MGVASEPTEADRPMGEGRIVLVGFDAANQAVAAALLDDGHPVVATDDSGDDSAVTTARHLGIELVVRPDVTALGQIVRRAAGVVPSPGLRSDHPIFALAEDADVPMLTGAEIAPPPQEIS